MISAKPPGQPRAAHSRTARSRTKLQANAECLTEKLTHDYHPVVVAPADPRGGPLGPAAREGSRADAPISGLWFPAFAGMTRVCERTWGIFGQPLTEST